jgi:hypothetical protein
VDLLKNERRQRDLDDEGVDRDVGVVWELSELAKRHAQRQA